MSTRPQRQSLMDDGVSDLIRRYQEESDEEIQEVLVDHFTPLVETLASKFTKGSEPFEDLVQVGMIGLLAALKRYDPDFGKSFESFAVPTIVGEIKRHIRDKTWSVHVPRRIKELGPRIKKAAEELTIRYQRSPSVDEIAQYLDVTPEEVLETMEMGRSYNAVSVDSPIEANNEGSQVTLLDLVGSRDAGFEKVDQQLLLQKAFQVLTDREQAIIRMTFFDNLSQKQVGDELGISQMHVSRLQRRALGKLREAIRVAPSEII
ncbi:RNA polymerase sigma factor SigB [Kroppenstedtia eburnea]|uniref:RNA polymerase sigma factor n=1 Tax=Kroppenstedtia eburnea TaxID=714067 RepID=A0A1N7P4Q1_9BACL|nr:RNA polymerase sigma factor SigB [Kroppenstedtia eburnea]QKI80851.1 RNA polymerase sigma factor SigB [Kroppenstedtia eburnea]SIT05538.1 RNA polymerase, sigma 37 subunit, RpsB/SigB [Kroppenstedtia eburnea]